MKIINPKQSYISSGKKKIPNPDASEEETAHKLVASDISVDMESSYLLLLHDLQEKIGGLKKIAEQQAMEKSRILAGNNRFVSIIAHDLRGPLASILGVMSLMKEYLKVADKKELEEYIDIASASAVITSNLLENLLVWTTSNNFELRLVREKINLAQLVNEEINNFRVTIKLKKISLSHTIDPSTLVCADVQMLKTIIRNLIGNAAKYTGPGGEVVVSATPAGSYTEITVRDNGKGMHKEELKALFNRNSLLSYRNPAAPLTSKRKGLGLMLCKEFVEMHGGVIRAESEYGKGLAIIFTVPLYTSDCRFEY